MTSIEDKVDRLCDLPKARDKQPRRIKKLLRVGGLSGSTIGLIKGLLILTVTAALISTMIGTYLVSQTDDIALEGRVSYDLYIDDIPMGADDYIMPPDTFTDDKLEWGETETFTHEFWSPPNNGNFSINCDVESWQPWLYPTPVPAHEFYGYEFKLLDELDNEITQFCVISGEPAREIKFVHTLDVHFAHTENPLPYALELEVTELSPPVAVNDTRSLPYDVVTTIDVLANDNDPNGLPLTITGVQANDTYVTFLIQGNQIKAKSVYAGYRPATAYWYDVSNGFYTTRAYMILECLAP